MTKVAEATDERLEILERMQEIRVELQRPEELRREYNHLADRLDALDGSEAEVTYSFTPHRKRLPYVPCHVLAHGDGSFEDVVEELRSDHFKAGTEPFKRGQTYPVSADLARRLQASGYEVQEHRVESPFKTPRLT